MPAHAQANVVTGWGHAIERTIPQLDMHLIPIPPGQTAEQVIARYENHPFIEYAELEIIAEPALTPNDPWFADWQRPLQILEAEAAWDITTGSPGVPIGVLDTGLDTSHFEFVDRIARGEIYGYDFADNDSDFDDTSGHGTAVGGIIAAQANNRVGIAGACWHNPVVVMRTAFGLDTVEAITWATDNGVRVISMSFGSYTPTSWQQDAMQYAFDRGVVLVGAAGNDGLDWPFYPAAYPAVLAVTGVTGSGNPIGYNWGNWIDLSAPTGLTTIRDEDDSNGDGLSFVGGTSIATPFVAAAAGLVLSVNPDLTPTQVMDILRSTADDISDPGFDVLTGHGRVNFHAAVLAAMDASPLPPDTEPPTVTIAFPGDGDVVSGDITILADAIDNVRVSIATLFVDGAEFGQDAISPHQWTLDTSQLSDADHTLFVTARDAVGNVGRSDDVLITVDNAPEPPPTVELVVFNESLNKRNLSKSHSVMVGRDGILTATLTFGAKRSTLRLSVFDPTGLLVMQRLGISPIRVVLNVMSGNYRFVVQRINKNGGYALTVEYPANEVADVGRGRNASTVPENPLVTPSVNTIPVPGLDVPPIVLEPIPAPTEVEIDPPAPEEPR